MSADTTPLVLVVDDDPTNVVLLSHILKKSGYRVGQANSGRACLEYLQGNSPDLIVLDIRMPEMDGFEVCRRLKANEKTASIPVMFLTAEGRSDENIEAGFGAGAIDFITKPFSRVDVLARIQLVLRQRALQESYKELAHKDPLTGLNNRRRLYERLTEIMSEADRYERVVSLAMIDLDWFKEVNDTHGHDFGDQVLIGFAQLLETQCRLEDVTCRFGGEEFLVVMPNTSIELAASCAERLRIAWEQTTLQSPQGDEIRVTASFGVACSLPGESATDGDNVVRRADRAMYAAKNRGRNRVIRADHVPADFLDPSRSEEAGEPGS
ncbi:MAG: diguanylate cyclase [Phycisphaerae bacterium]|nr:diguanylate cyclase [Phycisphaerae bacterium]